MKKTECGCDCKKCIDCCYHSAGWFGSIEEVKNASKIMKMNVKDFVKEFLIEEWWGLSDGDISVIAPRKNFAKISDSRPKSSIELSLLKCEMNANGKGFVRASWGHNLITGFACIFLDENNRCLIHKSKPQECRESFGCKKDNATDRSKIAEYWKEHKNFIEGLKG